jgi:serine/threonine protein kinase
LYADTTPKAQIKISDFGLAKFLSTTSETMSTPCGTPGYVAPEVLKCEKYGPEVDLWSIGVILYILLCGFPPFYDETAAGLYDQIKKGDYDFPAPYWNPISEEAKDLVRKLLTVDPKQRCTIKQLLAHPWIAEDKAKNVNLGDQFNKKLMQFNARRKLRKAITMVLAMNKLARNLGGFMDELKS